MDKRSGHSSIRSVVADELYIRLLLHSVDYSASFCEIRAHYYSCSLDFCSRPGKGGAHHKVFCFSLTWLFANQHVVAAVRVICVIASH